MCPQDDFRVNKNSLFTYSGEGVTGAENIYLPDEGSAKSKFSGNSTSSSELLFIYFLGGLGFTSTPLTINKVSTTDATSSVDAPQNIKNLPKRNINLLGSIVRRSLESSCPATNPGRPSLEGYHWVKININK